MSEPTMVEQLGNHVLKQLPKNLGYDQRIKIMHSVQDFVRQWVDREQKAEWDLDAINDRLQTERDEALAALAERRKAATELFELNQGLIDEVIELKQCRSDMLSALLTIWQCTQWAKNPDINTARLLGQIRQETGQAISDITGDSPASVLAKHDETI